MQDFDRPSLGRISPDPCWDSKPETDHLLFAAPSYMVAGDMAASHSIPANRTRFSDVL